MKNRTEDLDRFIKEFIPEGHRFRKVTQNHIDYIAKTINGVFKKYSNSSVKYTEYEILTTFKKLNYKFEGEILSKDNHISNTVYVNVHTPKMRSIYNAIYGLSENTGDSKKEAVKQLNDELKSFFEQI